MALPLIIRCLELGWVKGGRRKLNEVAPGVPQDLDLAKRLREEQLVTKGYRAIVDGIELMCNFRGLGYDFGSGNGLRLPKVKKPEHNRQAWLIGTMKDIAENYIWIDAMASFISLQPWAPEVARPAGARCVSMASSLFLR